jgi:hypothetical protein
MAAPWQTPSSWIRETETVIIESKDGTRNKIVIPGVSKRT